MAEMKIKESPFSPGKPVPIEYFIARIDEIKRLERSISKVSSGRNENVFITGERGIGKSSLAGFVRYLAEKEYNFIGAHCYLGGIKDLEGMIRIIFQRLIQEVSDKTIYDKLKTIFNQYIKGLTFFGIGVEFTTDRSELRAMLDNFLPLIRKVKEIITDNKNGIILILDDLNGLTNVPEFAPFIKSFVDELATSKSPLPIILVCVGIPERRDEMILHQPSVARIFDVIDLKPMDQKESDQFFSNMFEKQNISIDSEALSLMVRFSGGFPMLMHEVGDAIFWLDDDNNIDKMDALSGIIEASENIGKKYLDPQVYRALRSDTYRSILRRIGKLPVGAKFQRKDLLGKVPSKEKQAFDNFLRRIEKLDVIRKTENRGEYIFINQLYHLYVGLETLRAEKESKKSNK
jgi:AAA+ ATPase superfamily predicted ATPase